MSLYTMHFFVVFLLLFCARVFNREIFDLVTDPWDITSDKGLTFVQKFKQKDIDSSGTFFGLLEFEEIPKSPFFQFEFKSNQEAQTEGQVLHLGFIIDMFKMLVYQQPNQTYQNQNSLTTLDLHIQKWLFFAFAYNKNSNQVDFVLRSNITQFEHVQIALDIPIKITQQNLLFTFFAQDLKSPNKVFLKSFQFVPQKLQNIQNLIFLTNSQLEQQIFLFQNKRGKNQMVKYSHLENTINLNIVPDQQQGPLTSLYESDKIFNFKNESIENYYFSLKLLYSETQLQKIKIFTFMNFKNEFLYIYLLRDKNDTFVAIKFQNQIQILQEMKLAYNKVNQIAVLIQKIYDEQFFVLQLQQNNTIIYQTFNLNQLPFEFQNFSVQYFQHLKLEQYQMLQEIKIESNHNSNYLLETKFKPQKVLENCILNQLSNQNFICDQCKNNYSLAEGKCILECPAGTNNVNRLCVPCQGLECDSNFDFVFSVDKIDKNSYLINFNQNRFGLQKNFQDLFVIKFQEEIVKYKTSQIDSNKYILNFDEKRIKKQKIEIILKTKNLSNLQINDQYKQTFILAQNNPNRVLMSISLAFMLFSTFLLLLILIAKPLVSLKIGNNQNSFFCIKLFQSCLILQLFQFTYFMKNELYIQKQILKEFNRIILVKFSYLLSKNFQSMEFFEHQNILRYMLYFFIVYAVTMTFYITLKIMHFFLKRQKKKVKSIYSTAVLKKLLIFKKGVKHLINNFEMKILFWLNLLFSPSLIFFSLRTFINNHSISQKILAVFIIMIILLFVLATYLITIKSKIVLFNTKFNKRYGFLYEGCQILQNYKPSFFSFQLMYILIAISTQYILKTHCHLYYFQNLCLSFVALYYVIRLKPIYENFWQKEQQILLTFLMLFYMIQFLSNLHKKTYFKFVDVISIQIINVILFWNASTLLFYLLKEIKKSFKKKQSDDKGSVIVPADANTTKYKDSQDKRNLFYKSLRKNRRSIQQMKDDKYPKSEQGDQEGIYFKEFILDMSDQDMNTPKMQNSPIRKIGDLAQQKNLKDIYKSDSDSEKTLQNFVNSKQRCLIQFPSSDFDNSSESNYYSQSNYQHEIKKSKFYKD